VSVEINRRPDGKFHLSWSDPIKVASTDPAELQRATQEMADKLTAIVGARPAQWYNFKPMWPATARRRRISNDAP
jgi:lauroyl/myristoyl acyltransferase